MKVEEYRKYIILTDVISSLGGAQLLVLRRVKYFKSLGLDVRVIIRRHTGDFFLKEEFAHIPVLFLPQVDKPFLFTSEKEKKQILDVVSFFVNDTDNTIIETNSLQESVWGEFFASCFKIKHVIYLHAEEVVGKYLYYPGKDFFYYKYKRGELWGVSDQSIKMIFGKDIDNCQNQYINVAFDPEEIKEKSVPSLDYLKKDKNQCVITTVTRLEKGYVPALIQGCIEYARKNPAKNILLLIIGGTIFPKVELKLKEDCHALKMRMPNLKIDFPGYMTTLGADLYSKTDIFIGVGTASINAISQGCVTLIIDFPSNRTSGIFGLDTTNFGYSQNNITFEIEDKIEELLDNSELYTVACEKGKELFNNLYTNKVCLLKMNDLLEKSDHELLFYNFHGSVYRSFVDYIIFFLKQMKRFLIKLWM